MTDTASALTPSTPAPALLADLERADGIARGIRLRRAADALHDCGLVNVIAALPDYPSRTMAERVIEGARESVATLRASCRASGDWPRYALTTAARDALGALWAVL